MFAATIFLIFAIFIISFATAYEPYYWRTYNGTIPNEAVLTDDPTIFVSRVCAGGHHDRISCFTSTYNSKYRTSTANVNGKMSVFYKNHMILCTSRPDLLRWEYVNTKTVQGNFLNKIASVGSLDGTDRYIGKVFHENEWKISTVRPNEGLFIWTNKDGSGVNVSDFQVLSILPLTASSYVPVHQQQENDQNECMVCQCSRKCN